jgi:hypothetical protein
MQIRDVRLQLERVDKRLEGNPKNQAIVASTQNLEKKMAAIEQELVQVKMKSSEGNLRYPNMLNEAFDTFSHSIENDAAPTAAMFGVFEQLNGQLDTQLNAWKQLVAADLPALNTQIQGSDVSSIQVIQPAAE